MSFQRFLRVSALHSVISLAGTACKGDPSRVRVCGAFGCGHVTSNRITLNDLYQSYTNHKCRKWPFQSISSDFIRFHQISSDFIRFHQISSDFIRFHQISSDFISSCSTCWTPEKQFGQGMCGILYDSVVPHFAAWRSVAIFEDHTQRVSDHREASASSGSKWRLSFHNQETLEDLGRCVWTCLDASDFGLLLFASWIYWFW